MKQLEKNKAIKLRKAGYSYKHIAKEVSVSKSTLSYWLSNIPYKPNSETIERIGRARAKSGEVKSRQKLDSITRAKHEAKKEIGYINKRDLFMLGLALYIGEGSKSYGITRVINANPEVIRFMVVWFREMFNMGNEHFMIRLHVYPDNNIEECVEFWRKATRLSKSQFQKTQVDKRINKKLSKRGKLPYGTAHLSVKSCGNKEFGVFLARKISAYSDEALNIENLRIYEASM